MTLDGTNTYLIDAGGRGIVVDPGPAIASHIDAICATANQRKLAIAAIAVTHGHPDHAPGAMLLRARTEAPVYGHREARFAHDRVLDDGDVVSIGDISLRAVDAPGHARDHLVFALEREALFTGDVIIGTGTVVIAPPGGDMRVYQATLARLRRDFSAIGCLLGGHGPPMSDASAKIDEYIDHRHRREREILALLKNGSSTIPQIVEHVYAGVSEVLWPAAARQVLAYLLALESEGRVRSCTADRPPTAGEARILNPDLASLGDPEAAAVAAAELGFDRKLDHVDAYRLAT